MADTQTKGLSKTVCPVCWKTHVHNGHYLRHIKDKHPGELSEIPENQSKEAGEGPNQVRLNNCIEVDRMDRMDLDDILPTGTPILIDKVEYPPATDLHLDAVPGLTH